MSELTPELQHVAAGNQRFIVSVVRDGSPALFYGSAAPLVRIWTSLRSIARGKTWQVVTLRERGRGRPPRVVARSRGHSRADARAVASEVAAELRRRPPRPE
jgi:hypothetical protein